jgi:hypothetical protein
VRLHQGGVAPPERLAMHASQGRLFQARYRPPAPGRRGGLEQPRRTWFRHAAPAPGAGGPVSLPCLRSCSRCSPRTDGRPMDFERPFFVGCVRLAVVEPLYVCPFVRRVPRARSSCGVLHQGGVAPPELLAVHSSQGRLFQTRYCWSNATVYGGLERPRPPRSRRTPWRSTNGGSVSLPRPRSCRSNSPRNHAGRSE